MPNPLRRWIERLLPWYHPRVEQARNARTARMVRRSEVARGRAARVIDEYRRAEDVASQVGVRATHVVTDFRDAQQDAREAGERLIEEVERPSDPT